MNRRSFMASAALLLVGRKLHLPSKLLAAPPPPQYVRRYTVRTYTMRIELSEYVAKMNRDWMEANTNTGC
jgi:hypothetical protein